MTATTTHPTDLAVVPQATRLRGRLRMPPDKSISHRALLLAAVATGTSRIANASGALDPRSTAACLRALGVSIEGEERDAAVDWRVDVAGSRGMAGAGRAARLRQLGHDDAPPGRAPGRHRAGRDARRRCLAARPADAARGGAAAGHGRHGRRRRRGDPAAAAGRRSGAAPVDRLDDGGAQRPGEVGHPARRPGRGRRHVGDRGDGHARPHRADAARPRRGGPVGGRRGAGGRRRPAGLDRRRSGRPPARRDGPGRHLRGRLLARGRRGPSGRRTGARGRRRQPHPAGGHRPPAGDGRLDHGERGGRLRRRANRRPR